MHLFINLDYETSERCGAGGMFQVISITDEQDNDYTNHVDQGTHYSNLQEVKVDLEKSLGFEVELEEV